MVAFITITKSGVISYVMILIGVKILLSDRIFSGDPVSFSTQSHDAAFKCLAQDYFDRLDESNMYVHRT